MSDSPAPALILLCLGSCHGDFYLPLELNEPQVCPNDSEHPVAVYAFAHRWPDWGVAVG